jgi:hypothetical protein
MVQKKLRHTGIMALLYDKDYFLQFPLSTMLDLTILMAAYQLQPLEMIETLCFRQWFYARLLLVVLVFH